MPSPKSSRLNLERFRKLVGLRSDQESLLIKHAIWHWILTPDEDRCHATLRELARQLGISRQYAERIAKRVNLDAPLDLLERSPAQPGELRQQHARHDYPLVMASVFILSRER